MVNPRTFLDISIEGQSVGRVIFELFADRVPKTAENFRALSTGSAGLNEAGIPLTYKGSPFHRIIAGFMVQGGDFTLRNGKGGESIYGGTFEDEDLKRGVDAEGLLVMANKGKNTNGSQFFVSLRPCPHLDGKHVVFGRVVKGYDIIQGLSKLDTNEKDVPKQLVTITNCGELELRKELHGSEAPDAIRLCFIMGLNNSCFGWHHQVSYFGKLPNYSVLVLDNRGAGQSESPSHSLWKTSEMATDVVEVLDFVGWKEERSVNVIGVSMGGMIAQQVALAIPERIKTLLLTSTKCGDRFDLPSYATVSMFAKLLTNTAGTPAQIIDMVIGTLFPKEWLDEPGAGNRERLVADFVSRAKITKLQSSKGKVGQLAAVMGHKVGADKLRQISETIPKISIIVGDKDEIIDYHRSEELHQMLPGSDLTVYPNGGHALTLQDPAMYNQWILDRVEGKKAASA